MSKAIRNSRPTAGIHEAEIGVVFVAATADLLIAHCYNLSKNSRAPYFRHVAYPKALPTEMSIRGMGPAVRAVFVMVENGAYNWFIGQG